jgi:prevent-host-death family protein
VAVQPVTSIGVRELKQRASEILRRVRTRQEDVAVTLRGEVVAMLVPVARTRPARRRTSDPWTDIDRLAREIAARWPRGVSAAEAVRRQRRG